MISIKYLIIILLIVFLIIVIMKLHERKKNNTKNNNIFEMMRLIENMQDTTSYVRDEIVLERIKSPNFEENFKFDTMEKVSNNIEKFFNTYLNLINTNRINENLNEYITNKGDLKDISMQSIFTKKNLNLNVFSNKIYSLINKIYFANSKYINEDSLNLFGLFNVIKSKLNDNNLFTYNYRNFEFILVPKNMPNIIFNDETLNGPNNMIEEEQDILDIEGKVVGKNKVLVDKTRKKNIRKCYDEEHKNNICKLSIKNLAGQELIDRFSHTTGDIPVIRDEFANNLDKIIKLCELNIVRELILAYDSNISNTDNFKNLEQRITDTHNSIREYEEVTIRKNLNIKKLVDEI